MTTCVAEKDTFGMEPKLPPTAENSVWCKIVKSSMLCVQGSETNIYTHNIQGSYTHTYTLTHTYPHTNTYINIYIYFIAFLHFIVYTHPSSYCGLYIILPQLSKQHNRFFSLPLRMQPLIQIVFVCLHHTKWCTQLHSWIFTVHGVMSSRRN